MRTFEIIDSERDDKRPCAVMTCDQATETFEAVVADWAGPNDVPLTFMPFVEKGQRQIPSKWVRAWIDERIAPPSRQNIGQILRAHSLDRYDACELLVSGEGRSSQDDFYLHETTKGYREMARLGEEIGRVRAEEGLTQRELANKSDLNQEAVSRLENGRGNPTVKTLDMVARALGKRLRIEFV